MASAKFAGRMRRLSRLAVAIGGFLILIGLILTGTFLLALFDLIDVSAFVGETHLFLLMMMFLLIGILDVTAAIILSRR